MSLFRRKKKTIFLTLAGEEFKLFSAVLKSEIGKLEPKIHLNSKDSTIYSVAKRYYSMCLFDGVSNVLTIPFEVHDKSEMLTLIVTIMLASDSVMDPVEKAKYKKLAEKIQKAHKGLGE